MFILFLTPPMYTLLFWAPINRLFIGIAYYLLIVCLGRLALARRCNITKSGLSRFFENIHPGDFYPLSLHYTARLSDQNVQIIFKTSPSRALSIITTSLVGTLVTINMSNSSRFSNWALYHCANLLNTSI
jgi:hypothetical protein